MAPMYIVGRDITPARIKVAMRVWVVRTYDILERRGSQSCKKQGMSFSRRRDVIGRVVQIYSPLDKLIAGRPSRLIDFMIEDLKGNTFQCTVWDQHVEQVLPFYPSDLNEPLIVLIQLCRVKLDANTGDVRISSSYDATQLLFNKDCIEFVQFRESLCDEQTPLKSIASFSSFSYGNTLGDSSSGKMTISTITDIYERREFGDYWYYDSCKSKGCYKKLKQVNGLYSCAKYGTSWTEGVLRYRVRVRVLDANGTAPFLLWDRECVELLGITAAQLKAKQPEAITVVPKEIKDLVGTGRLFKVALRCDQLDNQHNAFPVMQIKDDAEILEIYYPGLSDNKYKDFSSKVEQPEEDWQDDEGFFFLKMKLKVQSKFWLITRL